MDSTRHRDRWALALIATVFLTGFAHAQSPSGKTIAEVIPENNRLQSDRRILGQMLSTRPGLSFSTIAAQEDVGRLMKTGWFRDVQIATKLTDDDRVQVFVVVEEFANVIQDIVYKGAEHIDFDDLDRITGLRRGDPMNPVRNQIARQAILREYRDKGRTFAQVHLREGGNIGDTRVVFEITEGPIVKVNGIRFVGNVAIGSGILKNRIHSSTAKLGFIGGRYIPAQVDLDIATLTDYYRGLGYHAVRVGHELRRSSDLSRVELIYHIQEGPRHVVRDVEINGNKVYDNNVLLAQTSVKPGDFYDGRGVQADLQNLKNYYGYRGRLVPVSERVVQTGPGEVSLQYEVIERPPIRAAQVFIEGNTVTRDDVIREQLSIFPGQILSYPDLLRAEANLARLGIFTNQQTGAQPTLTVLEPPDPESDFRDILVQVEEQPTGSILLGGGVNSDAGLSGSLVITERNFDITRLPTGFRDVTSGRAFRGGGQELRIELVPGTIFQRYTISFREPTLLNTPNSLATSAYYYTRGFAEFNDNRVGGRVSVGRQLGRFWNASFTTRMENVDIFDIPFNAPQSIARDFGDDFLLGLSGALTRDSRDSFIRPTTGSQIEASYEQVLGANTFPLGNVGGTMYRTLYEQIDGSGKHVVSVRSQLSFAGVNTPVYERFYGGGFRSLRGWEFRGVGPFENGLNVGGTFAFLNTLQYEVPILPSDKMFLVGFVDHGTVEDDVAIRDYRVSAGLGLRVSIPGMGPVPLAFDFAWPIRSGPGDREQVFSFYLAAFR